MTFEQIPCIRSVPVNKANRWGGWRTKCHGSILYHCDYKGYEVNLDEITDSASCLDWIMQISNKTWFSTQDVVDFIAAIRETVDPQKNLCPWGISKARNRCSEDAL